MNRAGLNALQLACMRGDRRRYQRICQGQAAESRDGASADGTGHSNLAAEPAIGPDMIGLASAPSPSPNGANHLASHTNGPFHTPTPPAQAGGSGMTLLVLRHCGLLELDARDPAGWCALHHAVQARNAGAVRALLAAGADFHARQGGVSGAFEEEGQRGEGAEEGATPLQLARAVKAAACATILEVCLTSPLQPARLCVSVIICQEESWVRWQKPRNDGSIGSIVVEGPFTLRPSCEAGLRSFPAFLILLLLS